MRCLQSTMSRTAMTCGLLASALLALAADLAGAQGFGSRDAESARGVIKSFTTAPKGEVDGATLDDGSYIHWPPHMGVRMSEAFKVGDAIEARGRREVGPEGDRRLEAEQVTNTRTGTRVDVEDGPRPRPPRDPRGRRDNAAQSITGRIRELTTAPKGEVDGALLADGTTIHWPPHLESRFKAVVAPGDEVRVEGWNETTPRGDSHFETRSLTNVRTGATVENEDAPPRGPRGEEDAGTRAGRGPQAERLQDLQRQLDRIQRELDRLRRQR